MKPLRIPRVLAFTVLGAAAGAGAMASCESGPPTVDARCARYCIYQTVDNGNCPPPTCATGTNHDQCPVGCIPEPMA